MNIIERGDILSGATFSPCQRYRYSLWRTLMTSTNMGSIAVIGLNPSVADEIDGDPTVTRCINRARSMGYGRFFMLNLFAWRDTDPKAMKRAIEPVGIENDEIIRQVATQCSMVVCAWGAHGRYKDRANKVLELLSDVDLYALKLTHGGYPAHPLYLPNKLKPFLWRAKS